jgi:hypothetical protein
VNSIIDIPDRMFNKILLLTLLFAVYVSKKAELYGQHIITHYEAFIGKANYASKKIILLRKFEQSDVTWYIGLDPNSLETMQISSNQVKDVQRDRSKITAEFKNSPYLKAVNYAVKQSNKMKDAGIVHGFPKENGITLTIDLCPSHKPLDRIIFSAIINEFKKIEKPAPVALSITGKFMLSHPEDIDWIKALVDSGEISVTWVNHTYSHYYNPKDPINENFLLKPGTSINYEILETEKILLENGLMFSVFFRFPGLVSDKDLVDSVLQYGLIPIGSDAWLAKGQKAYNGSIVLIHGNGNEPMGVKDFVALLKNENNAVRKKQWLLYDLRETIEKEFEDNTKKNP